MTSPDNLFPKRLSPRALRSILGWIVVGISAPILIPVPVPLALTQRGSRPGTAGRNQIAAGRKVSFKVDSRLKQALKD